MSMAAVVSGLSLILYCSRSRLTGSRADLETQTRRILATARVNNQRAGLTGAMVFTDSCFAQVLEGADADLMPIFQRIRSDPRHGDLRVLAQSQPTQRLFPHWSMAYVGTPQNGDRHPLAHFSFEAALTDGMGPGVEKFLDHLKRIVVIKTGAAPSSTIAARPANSSAPRA
jgi:hypothetical protein